jgi:hypothetical protein
MSPVVCDCADTAKPVLARLCLEGPADRQTGRHADRRHCGLPGRGEAKKQKEAKCGRLVMSCLGKKEVKSLTALSCARPEPGMTPARPDLRLRQLTNDAMGRQ